MASENYNSNPLLKTIGTEHSYTQNEVEEYVKCSQDPIYFIENYCKIFSLDKGIVPFKLYDCQKEKIETIHNNRKVLSMEARQNGKCFFSTTKYTIRNKNTGEIRNITAEEFHNLAH